MSDEESETKYESFNKKRMLGFSLGGGVILAMIFAISRGSNGSGPERYTAYLPFVLAPGAELSDADKPWTLWPNNTGLGHDPLVDEISATGRRAGACGEGEASMAAPLLLPLRFPEEKERRR